MIKIKLTDYNGKTHSFDVESDGILLAILQDVSGDEVLKVYRSGFVVETYDSDEDDNRIRSELQFTNIVCCDGEWKEWFKEENIVETKEEK